MASDVRSSYHQERINVLRKLAGCSEPYTFFHALKCPWCDAERIEFVRYTQHSNGLWREEIRFSCGFSAQIIPNYPNQPFFERGICTRSKPYIDIVKKREALREKLYRTLDAADVDNAERERLREAIRHVNTGFVSDI